MKLNIKDIAILNKKTFFTNSPLATSCIGKKFAKKLVIGDIVLLIGDLGTGKTTFTKGIVSLFNNEHNIVKSPSFVIVNEYKCKKKYKNINIFHIDLYRLSVLDIYNIGIEDYIYNNNISIIEWPNKFLNYFLTGYHYWYIDFKNIEFSNKREINIISKI
ncbi:MAG: tRNA (adenosine(37)-N6)-threonylcarbamoyltransferase complex ATPase subunit type 1 TsaE [Endomicrobium sp.]|jgi:tRNA threonylcarbamoyladenosine biosynthesis protein TsaE|nr:tRNA (adenosine(37)-N6)-threonylcarbamoyltransferase complex ATPase subunit type 1 TsaE [Endomicrobium sp.]